MKEQILKLRSEGKTYTEIKNLLNCSKATISYHCGEGQKQKTVDRTRKLRLNTPVRRLETFKGRKSKNLKETTRKFQKRGPRIGSDNVNKDLPITFSVKDIVKKFGVETECYLTGVKINLLEDEDYSFDHIVPFSKGGTSTFDNLGITTKLANMVKSDLTVEELVQTCKLILEKQGYTIIL